MEEQVSGNGRVGFQRAGRVFVAIGFDFRFMRKILWVRVRVNVYCVGIFYRELLFSQTSAQSVSRDASYMNKMNINRVDKKKP